MNRGDAITHGAAGRVGSASRASPLVYAAGLVGCEMVARFSIEISLAWYAVLLFVLVNLVTLGASVQPEVRAALGALALIPTLKIGAAALSQQVVPEVYWELFPGVLALAALVVLRGMIGPLALWVPLRRLSAWGAQLLIASCGPLLAIAAAYAVTRLGLVGTAEPGFAAAPASVVAVAAFSGFALEIVMRGVVQASFVRLYGWWGVAFVSVLYAGLFTSATSSAIIVIALVTGLFWGVAAAATKTVTGVALSHALFSVTWVLLF
jgi:hypothetical protein